ncbi:anti-sigma factor family protein [Syntrophomonas curvata]
MNCRQVDKYLYDYCDNILNPEQQAQIEEHLVECPVCSKIVDESLLESSILHEQWEIPGLPDDFTDRVMNQIACAAIQANPGTVYPHSPNRNRWSRRLIGLAAMGAILLLVLYVPAMVKNSDFMQIADRKQAPPQATHETIISGKLGNENLKLPAGARWSGEASKEAANDASLKNEQEESSSSPTGKINSNYGTHSVTVSNSEDSQTQDLNLIKADTTAALEVIPVQPVNLPASYVLLNRIDAAGSSTYTFGSAKNEEQLIINIAQLPLRQPVASTYSRGYIRDEVAPAAADKSGLESGKGATLPMEEQPAGGFGVQTGEQAKSQSNAAALAATNTISYELEFNNQKFLLTISAKLPPEELSLISTNLQLSSTK